MKANHRIFNPFQRELRSLEQSLNGVVERLDNITSRQDVIATRLDKAMSLRHWYTMVVFITLSIILAWLTAIEVRMHAHIKSEVSINQSIATTAQDRVSTNNANLSSTESTQGVKLQDLTVIKPEGKRDANY